MAPGRIFSIYLSFHFSVFYWHSLIFISVSFCVSVSRVCVCVHFLVCFLCLVFGVRGYAYICVTDKVRGSYLFDVTVFCVSFSSSIIIIEECSPFTTPDITDATSAIFDVKMDDE